MQIETTHPSRRTFAKLAGAMVAGWTVPNVRGAEGEARKTIPLFDGHTLDGWIQIENSATSLSTGGILDQAAFAAKLANGSDAVSAFLRGQLEDSVKADLATYSTANANAKTVMSAVVKGLNHVLAGPSIYDKPRFGSVAPRPETEELLKQNPQGQQPGQTELSTQDR